MNPFLHSTVAQPLGLTPSPDAPPAPLAESELRWDAARHQATPAHTRKTPSTGLTVATPSIVCTPDLSAQTLAPNGAHVDKPAPEARASSVPNASSASRQRGWGRLVSLGTMMVFAGSLMLGMTSATQAQTINANIATALELESIKGIGPKTARNIVHERQRAGPYESMTDLAERVRGIGPRKARTLRENGLTVSQGAARSEAAP